MNVIVAIDFSKATDAVVLPPRVDLELRYRNSRD
jgi:hypothetical protein